MNGLIQTPMMPPQPMGAVASQDQPAEEALKKRREKLATDKLGIEPPTNSIV